MMSMTMTKDDTLITLENVTELFRGIDARDEPSWLQAIHASGVAKFEELGLPTTKHEDWRLTNLDGLRKMEFGAVDGRGDLVDDEMVKRFAYPGLDCEMVVFVNGKFRSDLSQIDEHGRGGGGVVVCSFDEAIRLHEDIFRAHLGRYVDGVGDAFVALNNALFEDGVFIFVPAGQVVEKPIHIVNITVADESGARMFYPRHLCVVEDGASVTVIEDYVCSDEDAGAVYLTDAVTEFVVGKNAEAHHYLTEREGRNAFNISTLRVQQDDESDFQSHSALLGAHLVRNNILPRLAGVDCQSLLNGIYFGDGEQRIDNFMRVEHDNVNGDSRQYYKGILTDKAQATFSGRIVVAQIAQKTDAVQSNRNLLLSEDARAHSKPQLEIYADDVKCTHGATVGELDEEAMFYLQARGINETAARTILIHAFALESLERMELEPVREVLESLLIARLPEGEALRKIL